MEHKYELTKQLAEAGAPEELVLKVHEALESSTTALLTAKEGSDAAALKFNEELQEALGRAEDAEEQVVKLTAAKADSDSQAEGLAKDLADAMAGIAPSNPDDAKAVRVFAHFLARRKSPGTWGMGAPSAGAIEGLLQPYLGKEAAALRDGDEEAITAAMKKVPA